MGLLKNTNHFTDCFDKLLNCMERGCIGSLFMEYGNAESSLKKTERNLKDPDYTNELMKVSMDDSNINWKMIYYFDD